MHGIVPWDELSESLEKPLNKLYKKLGGSNEEQVAKLCKRLTKKIPTYLPIVTNAIFRFFDQDGSGTVSKEEIILVMSALGPPEGGPRYKNLLPALFRTLDADGSGAIEPVEVQPFITEIILAIAKLATALINELENDLKGGLKVKVLKKVQTIVDSAVEDGMPYPFPKETLIGMAMGDESFDFEGAEDIRSMPIPAMVTNTIESIFTRFHEVAKGEPMPIKKAAEIMASCIVPGLTAFCDPNALGAMVSMMQTEFEDQLPFDLDDFDLSDVLSVAGATASAYLKSGAMKRYLEAVLSFLDINNDGDITEAELKGIYEAAMATKNATNEEEFNEAKTNLIGKVFDIFDSDGNGTFDMDDVPKIVDKATEFGCSLIYLQIEMLKTIATACVLPTLNLGFHMFTEDGTVSLEMVKMLVAGDDDNGESDDDASLEMVSVTVSP